jgi:hypothetical protein
VLLLPKFVGATYLSKLAIAASQLTVRIHTNIVTKYQRWCKLWYFLRGLDRSSSGFGRILLADICYWLGAAPSTIRQWLREGKAAGAFRFWAERRGIISIAIGSRSAVVIGLKLYAQPTAYSIRRAWGEVSEISIFQLNWLRCHATAVTTQHLQSQSHFAAKIVNAKDRQRLRVPTAEDLFEAAARASQNAGVRALLPFVSKFTSSKIWVSKSFPVFGTCQQSIAKVRGFCDRTIRNHLSILGIERKQVVQTKAIYGDVAAAIDQGTQYETWGEGKGEVTLTANVTGWNRETDQPILAHKLCEGLTGEFPRGGIDAPRSRFFQAWGKWWMYRTNVYDLNYSLHSNEFARGKWWDTYCFQIMGKHTTNPAPTPPSPKKSNFGALRYSKPDNSGLSVTLRVFAEDFGVNSHNTRDYTPISGDSIDLPNYENWQN